MGVTYPSVFGPYWLLGRLGQGATGEVALARPIDPQLALPTPLVIKRLHAQLSEDEEFVARFDHEAQVAIRVQSPKVAAVYDVGQAQDSFYIAMEYVAGFPMSSLLRRMEELNARMPLPVILSIMGQALEGVEALHNLRDDRGGKIGFVHRDLAPKNIMAGDDGRIRIIDLGLGRSRLNAWKTQVGVVMGSPGYMAPEQLRAQPHDHRADVFAMGTVLHELLTGRRYIEIGDPMAMMVASTRKTFEPPSKLQPQTPQALDRITRRAMAVRPEERFGSAEDFAHALRAVGPWAPREQVQRFIESLLSERARARQAEVARLCALPTPEDARYAAQDTRVIARTTLSMTQVEPLTPTRVLDQAPTVAQFVPATKLANSPMESSELYRRRGRGRVAAAALTVIAGVAVGGALALRYFERGSLAQELSTPVPKSVQPKVRPQAAPKVLARPQASEPERLPPSTKKPDRPARPHRPERPRPTKAPAPKTAEPPALHAKIQALLERAGALKKRRSDSVEVVSKVNRLLARLALVQRTDPKQSPRVRAQVQQLERELRKLESSP